MRAIGHRIAQGTVAATFLLILAGGLVTNTGSALAVPDWPTTFGHNMFLYPWSEMVGGVFYEHSHRLLGSLVGLLTVALAVVLWFGDSRRWVRGLGAAAVLLVILQGVLGGLRVVLREDAIAIVHGCLAQAFFALAVTLALVTSRSWRDAPAVPARGSLTWLAAAAVALLYTQIVFGAFLTHAGQIDPHLAGAAAVFALVPSVAARARRSGQRLLARPAALLLALLLVEAALGIGAYLARFSPVALPGGQTTTLALPVAHRLVAALILGSAVALLATLLRTSAARAPTMSAEPVGLRPAAVGTNS